MVTLDGKPLSGGLITFFLRKDPTCYATAAIKPDGTFKMNKAPLGEVLVAITTENMKSHNPQGYVPIPKRYWDATTSDLTATVTKGGSEQQKLSFDLQSE